MDEPRTSDPAPPDAPRPHSSSARWIAAAVVVATVAAGVYFWGQSLERPDDGRMPAVAEVPAGGRTQAAGGLGDSTAIPIPGLSDDPLVAGVPEAPDIPRSHAHMGLASMGERIREAVLEDGTVGDDEVPGIALAGLTQPQRRWLLDRAIEITCPCGCDQDLLECRRDDATCPVSPGLADSLVAVARSRP